MDSQKTTFEEPEDFAALYGATPDRWTGVVRRILDYLKRHAYRIASNRIPLHLLAWWQLPEMPPMSEWAKPCGCLVRRRRRNMLLRYIVFGKLFDEIWWRHYRLQPDYRERLEVRMDATYDHLATVNRYLPRARRAGEAVPEFDLLDVDALDRIAAKLRRNDDRGTE